MHGFAVRITKPDPVYLVADRYVQKPGDIDGAGSTKYSILFVSGRIPIAAIVSAQLVIRLSSWLTLACSKSAASALPGVQMPFLDQFLDRAPYGDAAYIVFFLQL